MKLTPEAHRRGLLSWTTRATLRLRTDSTDDPALPPKWSEYLTDPTGSLVQSSAHRFSMLAAEVVENEALLHPFEVRWQRALDDKFFTRVYKDDFQEPPTVLTHLPGFGIFHRLVVSTPYLAWEEEATVCVEDTVIRILNGSLEGELVTPGSDVEITEEGTVAITGASMGTAYAKGRLLEIVTPGENPARAEARAFAILGLMALIVGPNAIGDVVFSEAYKAEPLHQYGTVKIPITARMPREAEGREVDRIDAVLAKLTIDDRGTRSGLLALSWYEKGLRSSAATDAFLAFYVGVEALVNSYASEHGPPDVVEERRQRLEPLIHALSSEFDGDELASLLDRLVSTSFAERAEFYRVRSGWEETFVRDCRQLARLRNSLVHGDVSSVDSGDVAKVRELLERLLGANLTLGSDHRPGRTTEVGPMGFTFERVQPSPDGDER